MKISNQTLQVLKNYASINPNLLVQAGNVLTTISVNKNIFDLCLDSRFILIR